MILLQVNQLNKYFGADHILSDIKLEIQSGDSIGLVGRNGSGKSTLLKIIAGQMSYDSGEIVKPKDVTIGYLAQDAGLESELSIWEEMLSVFEDLREQEKELRRLENEMANPAAFQDPAEFQKILKVYDRLQTEFKEKGGYQYEADIRSVLHGLNFHDYDYSTKISALSGGQKTRLALGKLLLTKPDILILDEPTNHLDIETLSWLEQFLQNYKGAILVVSHDRYFLDKIVNQVYELSGTKIIKYTGNYTAYLEQKAKNYERQLKLYEKQQEEIAKLEDFIQRNIARAATAKLARSRRKQLQRMERISKPAGYEKTVSFGFKIEKQSGNDVLKIEDLSVGYGKKPVCRNISFRVTRGESIAIVGPNGIGKSTLLKTIVNKLPPLSGTIRFGTNVTIAYYDQELADLHSGKDVLHELWDDHPLEKEQTIRTVLGSFLFSGDDVFKPVQSLSGGEKARLALAKLMMKNANLLILDEPTNHLDLESKEVLESALIDFPGTILFVSHDRYFINRIATKVLELDSTGVTEYLGDYDYYVEKKREQEELAKIKAVQEKKETVESSEDQPSYKKQKEARKLERQRQRKLQDIEDMITMLEEQIEKNNLLLCKPDVYQDHEKVRQIQKENEEALSKLDELLDEWAELAE